MNKLIIIYNFLVIQMHLMVYYIYKKYLFKELNLNNKDYNKYNNLDINNMFQKMINYINNKLIY
jgi:hypothetical protein